MLLICVLLYDPSYMVEALLGWQFSLSFVNEFRFLVANYNISHSCILTLNLSLLFGLPLMPVINGLLGVQEGLVAAKDFHLLQQSCLG